MDEVKVIDSALARIVLQYLEKRETFTDDERFTLLKAIERIAHPLVIIQKENGQENSSSSS